jgi:ketosteroid isomerase-like protein
MTKYEKEFERFMTEQRNVAANAYVSGNSAPVTALSTTSDPATFFGPGGGLIVGATKVISTNERGARSFAPGSKSKFKVVQKAAADGLAFWSGVQSAQVKFQGKSNKVTMDLRVTEVFRREKGAWKLIHRHADMLAKPAKSKK